MIRRILILLAALALGLSGLSASAEVAFEAGELHVYRVSMDENETVPVRWYKDTPSFPEGVPVCHRHKTAGRRLISAAEVIVQRPAACRHLAVLFRV